MDERKIAWVDTIDACHLKCPTCIRGVRGLQNSAGRMDLETFAAIVARLREQDFSRIGLFNWTEPFLNREIHKYVAAAKQAGFWVNLSSTLSLPRIENMEATLAAGLDLLTVSISGIDQQTYEINHVGASLEYAFSNLSLVQEILRRRALPVHVDLRFLKFAHNAHQEAQLRSYAESMGFHFEVLTGVGDPTSNALRDLNNERFVRDAEAAAGRTSPEDEGRACELMFNQIAIDCLGDVYICCAMPVYPSLRIGKFLDMTADEMLAAKFRHPFCRACTMPRRDRTPEEDARVQNALQAVQPQGSVASEGLAATFPTGFEESIEPALEEVRS
jgi:MoaA/NifB/PqqE/SkfB family radical SAM enzyme